MATYDATPNGGTSGHPAEVARPYVLTSKVWDTADGGAGGDVIQLLDIPADTMIVSGVLEVLEARDVDAFIDGSVVAAGFTPFLEAAVGASGANARVLTTADTIDALLIDAGSSGESALRFRVHVVLVDISKNPVETASVSTGT